MTRVRHPEEEDGVDDSDGSDTGDLFSVPQFQADATDPRALWQEAMAASSQEAVTTSSWYSDRADTETAVEAPSPPAAMSALGETDPPQGLSTGYIPGSLTAHAPGDMPGEMGTISGMQEQPPSPPSPPPSRTWQSRITAAERRPGPARSNARQAHLTLARVEPWSVLKFSFVASLVAFVILFVAVLVLYLILAGMGVFDSLQSTATSITSSQNTAGTDVSGWFSASTILGYTALIGALNIVLIPALCTVGAVIYNLIAEYFGGVEVTFRESD